MARERFILTGPLAGKTGVWGGCYFEEGVCEVVASPEALTTLERLLGTFYGVVTEVEYQRRVEAGEIEPLPERTQETQQPERTQETQPPTPPTPEPEPQAAAPSNAGDPIDGDMDLAEAIAALNPDSDGHWTSNNLPSLEVLAEMTGKRVARSEVEAIAAGYTRAKARQARG